MIMKKTQKMHWLGAISLAVLMATSAQAQQMLPTDTEAAQLEDAIAQTTGEFDQVNLGYIHSLGMQQKAWNDPLSHMGEGQLKPGYSRYNWSPDVILPIRLREGMMTLINLPAWELIEKVHIGSPESFGGEVAAPNSLLLYADPAYIGVDCNMIVFGRSGNRYVFYLRSETYNTDKITQSVVDVLVGPRYTPVSEGGKLGNFNGATATAAATSGYGSSAPGWSTRGNLTPGGAQNPQIGLNTASTGPKNWLGSIPVDPEQFRFDIEMYLPNPDDVDIAPDNVWRDNIFTYIDLGPKALTMTQRPVVNLIVQDSEVPVGFRTRGPNSRLIVVEAVGDLVLRNGKKIICLKLRRDPTSGLEYVDYSGSNERASNWNAPALPDNYPQSGAAVSAKTIDTAGKEMSSQTQETSRMDEMLMRKQSVMTMKGDVISPEVPGINVADTAIVTPCMDECSETDAYDIMMQQQKVEVMVPLPTIPTTVRHSKEANAGISGIIGQMTASSTSQRSFDRATTVGVDTETISVELASNADIANLEKTWNDIVSQNGDILKGYEPYYSVDTTADGDVRELFRLRIGPMADVKTGDTLCRKLGRRGVSCSVIRVQ